MCNMIIVSIIRDNCIDRMFEFKEIRTAEKAFERLVRDNNREDSVDQEDMDSFLEDGYCECVSGATICIGAAETDFDSFLKYIA